MISKNPIIYQLLSAAILIPSLSPASIATTPENACSIQGEWKQYVSANTLVQSIKIDCKSNGNMTITVTKPLGDTSVLGTNTYNFTYDYSTDTNTKIQTYNLTPKNTPQETKHTISYSPNDGVINIDYGTIVGLTLYR